MEMIAMKYFVTTAMEYFNLEVVVVNTIFLRLKNTQVKTLLWIFVWYLASLGGMESMEVRPGTGWKNSWEWRLSLVIFAW